MVTFAEVPDEIALCINISNCPVHCPDCHSKELWQDIGMPLTEESLDMLILNNPGITCVAFMGGDKDPEGILQLCKHTKHAFSGLKTAWYSGYASRSQQLAQYIPYIDYIKAGPYIASRGPLNDPNTNQRMYYFDGKKYIDITHKFHQKSPF